MSRRALLACALASTLFLGGVAHAQSGDSATEARQQYQLGTKAFSSKRYSEAALHFESAAALKPSAIALYTAALAWDLASRPERAADAYARALDIGGLDDKQTSTAKDRINALEQTLGTLAVAAPDGWKVQLDAFTEVGVPAKLHGSPGSHQLTIRQPGKKVDHKDVTLEGGKTTPLDLKEPPPPPKDEPKVEPTAKVEPPKKEEPLPPRLRNQFWTTPRAAGVGVGGFGVATLIATAIIGTQANSAGDAYKAGPTQASLDHASSLQTWTNVTLVAGLVFLAGGIALVAIPIGQDNNGMHGDLHLAPNGLGGTF